MTIKAIYFDLGGVIVRTGDRSPRENLGAEFGMNYEEMGSFVFESKSAAQASIGKLTEKEHWMDVTRRLNRSESDIPHIREAFFAGDRIDPDIVNFLRSRRREVKTGLISNAWDDLRQWIITQKFEDAFDAMIISAEVGIAKPDPRIYQFALEKFGVQASEAVFVDDMEKNITACEALGMHGVLFRSSQQTLAEVNELLNR